MAELTVTFPSVGHGALPPDPDEDGRYDVIRARGEAFSLLEDFDPDRFDPEAD